MLGRLRLQPLKLTDVRLADVNLIILPQTERERERYREMRLLAWQSIDRTGLLPGVAVVSDRFT